MPFYGVHILTSLFSINLVLSKCMVCCLISEFGCHSSIINILRWQH
uniref:Uncharacterized protein n=1 Tax=Arundo donax TaxID=35708 RepID=A0A0A8ZF44_ARUDO